ncbi:MAG: helix-turn-helix domain-containing protein, partial [Pseudonocardiaceae bacterium]
MEPSAQERAFAAEVQRYRLAAGFSQAELANRIWLHRSKVSELCNGRYLPATLEALDRLISVLGMDRERAVELWRAARRGQAQRRRADKTARSAPPGGWDSLPVLPAEVQSLLRAQVRAANEFPYRLLARGGRISLSTVYVRQELGSRTEEPQPEQPRPEPMLDGSGRLYVPAEPRLRLTVRPPARTVPAALDDHEHLLVTGGPGQGKSALSLQLAADIATAWMAHVENDGTPPLTEPVIPLRLTARQLAA